MIASCLFWHFWKSKTDKIKIKKWWRKRSDRRRGDCEKRGRAAGHANDELEEEKNSINLKKYFLIRPGLYWFLLRAQLVARSITFLHEKKKGDDFKDIPLVIANFGKNNEGSPLLA